MEVQFLTDSEDEFDWPTPTSSDNGYSSANRHPTDSSSINSQPPEDDNQSLETPSNPTPSSDSPHEVFDEEVNKEEEPKEVEEVKQPQEVSKKTSKRFDDGFAYIRHFKPLIGLERLEEVREETITSEDNLFEDRFEMISFERMYLALDSFARDLSSVSSHIRRKLLGHYVSDEVVNNTLPEELSAPNLPKLNESQENAVRGSLQSPLSLIQGPPGTGKTVTSATIVYHLVKCSKTPVLVCAQSNTAVDELTEKIERTGVKVVRLYSKKRERLDNLIQLVAVHRLAIQQFTALQRLQQIKDEDSLNPTDQRAYDRLKALAETSVLNKAEVICCTCVGAGDQRLKDKRFGSLLIDESMQATEPECVVPIVLGIKQLVLVGDHKQLGPVVKSVEAARDGLSESLFERLVDSGTQPQRLEIQYRMHPFLMTFPSQKFYDNSIQNGVTSFNRKLNRLSSFWPNPSIPTFFYCCRGQEISKGSGYSLFNRREVSYIENIVTQLLKCGLRGQQIGVITPYDMQRECVVHFLKHICPQVEVASVNAFQGREKDLIIFSSVRSNNNQSIGFLNDPRRLNVALTRARYGLIIVGNPEVLSSDPLWKDLLVYYQKNDLIMDGPLNALKSKNFGFN